MRVLSAYSHEALREAAEIVARGGVVVYPTDTLYGIGCDPFKEEAVKRVYSIKRREQRPMPVLARSLSDLSNVCRMSSMEIRLASLFWPGPLSLVVEKNPSLPSIVSAGRSDVAVRVPGCIAVLEVMHLCGGPIIGTSANISGEAPPSRVDEVPREVAEEVDLVIDGGRTRYSRPSTVLKLEGDELLVVREGAVSVEEVSRVVREADLGLVVRSSSRS